MTIPFTHLHLHTEYSLLDGAIRIKDLIAKTKEYQMESVAITDHGAMFGALEFYNAACAAEIKPIIGCEFYITPTSRSDRKSSPANQRNHLVLLAMNYEGYKNMMRLASIAQLEGFYYKPRIDMEVLQEHNAGIIALTACIKGEIPWLIYTNNMKAAQKRAQEYYEVFGDRLYFELQENGLPEQSRVNDGMRELADGLNVPLVATNDCHYLLKDDAHAHEILLCVQTGRPITDPKHFRFATDEFYFKSPEIMKKNFDYVPESILNTQEVAERCNLEIPMGEHFFPAFPIKANETVESMFRKSCIEGLDLRFQEMQKAGTLDKKKEKEYQERLEMEMEVIVSKGFPAYFLIVADFIVWAKEHDIPVGPGRGSGAGSLAAFCMQITNIDPILYGLIFERFLNVERKSMPDFDVDFCQERRGEVIDYVRHKYGGEEYVAQIITYGKMKAKGAVRDVGRALDIPLSEVEKIAKLIPEELKMTIAKAMEQEPKLGEMAQADKSIAELLKVSQRLEGLSRHTGMHAAGVVISPKPMYEYLPLARRNNSEPVTTQFDGPHTEMTGLIKFDFLGLKTLTVINKALEHVKADKGFDLDIDTIPMDDQATFELLGKGDALGVFQLESAGMRELVAKMAPEQFTDLIALVALYRPGPLESGMVDDFVDTKHGRKDAEYPLPQLEDVLKETYGVIVYQEQVMKIANILAGYTLGDADNLRRAMGKKKPEVMAKEKVKFMAGAKKLNIDEEKAAYVFDLMEKFAGYGFNKSHSAAYALVCYQTAYLKAHYMPQFMAGLLSCDRGNTEKVVRYTAECSDHEIEVLPPDINESIKDFSVKKDKIRFGLAAIKNVGEAALDIIIEEREENGNYTSIFDFCNRVDSRKVNSRVIESLIKAGTFDSLGYNRSQFMDVLEKAMEQAKAVQRDKQSGQMSLFGIINDEMVSEKAFELKMPEGEEWDERYKLECEKETVGFYITGHPLNKDMAAIKSIVDCQLDELVSCPDESAVRVAGLIKSIKKHRTKKGDLMAFVEIEDVFASAEIVVFPSAYSKCEAALTSTDIPLVIEGKVQQDDRGAKILAETVEILDDAREKYTKSATVRLQVEHLNRSLLENVKEIFYKHHGTIPVQITLCFPDEGEVDVDVLSDMSIRPCDALSDELDNLLGEAVAVAYSRKPTQIAERKRWKSKTTEPVAVP